MVLQAASVESAAPAAEAVALPDPPPPPLPLDGAPALDPKLAEEFVRRELIRGCLHVMVKNADSVYRVADLISVASQQFGGTAARGDILTTIAGGVCLL